MALTAENTLLEQVQTDQVILTETAAQAVRDLLSQRKLEGYALRIFISGGGCSGYQYGMALEGKVREQDLVFEEHGVKVVVDEVSIQYLRGATVDYVDDPMGAGFKINNPNALTTCGCGQSNCTDNDPGSSSSGCGGSCHS